MKPASQQVRSSRDLGQVIAAARRRRGLTQRQVAAALGVTQAWISRVEQGKQRTWVGQVLRLMAWLGIDLACAIREDSKTSRAPNAGRSHPKLDDIVD
jgi:HTH-type transcriptional regulator/antitoxin HipB